MPKLSPQRAPAETSSRLPGRALHSDSCRLGIAPIEGATFHGLRRTYASLRAAVGDDPAYTSEQIGHDDPRFTLRVYTYATKRRQRPTSTHRQAFDRALEWAQMGTNADCETPPRERRLARSGRRESNPHHQLGRLGLYR